MEELKTKFRACSVDRLLVTNRVIIAEDECWAWPKKECSGKNVIS